MQKLPNLTLPIGILLISIFLLPIYTLAQNGHTYDQVRTNLIQAEQELLQRISMETATEPESIKDISPTPHSTSTPRASLNLDDMMLPDLGPDLSDEEGAADLLQTFANEVSQHEVLVAREVRNYRTLGRELERVDQLSLSTLQEIYSFRSRVILLEEAVRDLNQSETVIRITAEREGKVTLPGHRGHPINKVANIPAYKVNFDLPQRDGWEGPGEGKNFGDKKIPPSQPVAYVTSIKPLYAGPRTDRLKLGELPNGTRVAITEVLENWYRVITEDGTRGWITGLHLSFGPRYHEEPGQTVRLAAYNPESDRTDWNPKEEFIESQVQN